MTFSPRNLIREEPPEWFAAGGADDAREALGFRFAPGGVHLTKTMMLAELTSVLNNIPNCNAADVERSVVVDNLLGKPTGTARRLAVPASTRSTASSSHGPFRSPPSGFGHVMLREGRSWLSSVLWLASRCCANPPPLSLDAPLGEPVRWPDLASAIAANYPDRYSPKMLRSLAQNCASSWTQSGHLDGRVKKRRRLARTVTGGGSLRGPPGFACRLRRPALVLSPWMRLLDRSEADLLSLLRRAESAGLTRVKAGGGVLQIDVRRPMAQLLEIPDLADRG